MTSKVEHRGYRVLILCVRRRVATAALALAAVLVAGLIAMPSARAQTLTTLFSFDSTDGSFPPAALVQGTDGNFYEMAFEGGANNDGTVFKITPSGTLTTLHSFDGTDGANPLAALIQATDGNFYGATGDAGANGFGTVFKMTSSGTLTTLYNFCSQSGCTDGSYPNGLVQATNGNFYGTAFQGGANNDGTVFEITPSGTLTTLYSFCSQSNCTDGSAPFWGLIQAANGSLYGTTDEGGANGYGTIFKITPRGTLTTLHTFDGTDGTEPNGLAQAIDGSFYGTASGGGANGQGTVFKITSSGTFTTLYNFCSQSGCTDGLYPGASPVQATDGNFYGTAPIGGANCTDVGGCGTVFKITPAGTLTTLYSFCRQSGCVDGEDPVAALVQGTNGSLYGVTNLGGTSSACGSYGCGTAFSLSVGLGPFVETQTTSGKVGATVKILGTDLTGATSVTFNGTATVFNVASPSLIETKVPVGATTGAVKVVTPRGTLTSNVYFRVEP